MYLLHDGVKIDPEVKSGAADDIDEVREGIRHPHEIARLYRARSS